MDDGEPAPEWSWCEIEWVRTFRASEFEARPLGPGVADAPARSTTFRWREDKPPPETSAGARGAHEELVHLLVAEGWEPVGNGGPWYAERFRRPASPNQAEVSVQRAMAPRPVSPRQLGIVVLTLASLGVIIFTLLVLLGFFVGK